jgi:hypothetical protein
MGSFVKTKTCPASERLVAFQAGMTDSVESAAIERHLTRCEFCEAEVELYGRFPPAGVESTEAGQLPEPLRELAEALLRKKADLKPLYKLVAR